MTTEGYGGARAFLDDFFGDLSPDEAEAVGVLDAAESEEIEGLTLGTLPMTRWGVVDTAKANVVGEWSLGTERIQRAIGQSSYRMG